MSMNTSTSTSTKSATHSLVKPLKIAFIHPDLGIGGAERLIVDAAMALKLADPKNDITIHTSHCDRTHCFEEIKNNELNVQVSGDFLPTNLNGKFKIVFAFLRQFYLCLKLIITFKIFQYDLIILDQLSYCIPLLKLFSGEKCKILFYCHFPDKLLASHNSLLRKLYRSIFDFIEELSTSFADQIVVNSNFTKSVVEETFPSVAKGPLDVVYPCVSTDESLFQPSQKSLDIVKGFLRENSFFLSVNRYERKKNIELAIESYAKYIQNTNDSAQSLVICGGYDKAVAENNEYLNELELLCDKFQLSYEVNNAKLDNFEQEGYKVPEVLFLTSISTDLKNALIFSSDCLLYTPKNEHFGIVPLEAMRMGKLVLADSSGGPLETVVSFFDDKNNYTGVTVDSNVDKWCDVLEWIKSLTGDELEQISTRCKERVEENFSSLALKDTLVSVINKMEVKNRYTHMHVVLSAVLFIVMSLVFKQIL